MDYQATKAALNKPVCLIQEWHTSDLNQRCDKRVQLKHEGKAINEVPGAMFRGLIFGKMAECWHAGETFDIHEIHESIRDEGRVLTKSAMANVNDTVAECKELLSHYTQRFGDWFAHSKMIGVEVPVRWSIDVDGEPAHFASHLDLLYRDPNDLLRVDDIKTGDTDWGNEYAGRSIQLGMYFMAVQYGQVMIDEEWIKLDEAPTTSIIDADNLWPYTRKTEGVDINGQPHTYVKGDLRPEWLVRREVLCNNEHRILEQFATKVRMARANFWPMNPTDTGCRVCECRKACPTWSSNEQENA